MRRHGLVPVLAFAFLIGAAGPASAALYVGGGHGNRISFRVKGDRVVAGSISTHLYCTIDPGNRRLKRHENLGYANPANPLRIDKDGFFREIEDPGVSGESFSTEGALIAHVGPNLIKGRFEYSYVVSEEEFEACQTNRFPYGSAEVRFRARRVR